MTYLVPLITASPACSKLLGCSPWGKTIPPPACGMTRTGGCCDELDVITDAARACEGVFGARLTGAGFGGCAIALIAPGCREHVEANVRAVFQERFGVEPGFDLMRAGGAPGELGA